MLCYVMLVCMYVCMYVCLSVCMYVFMYVCMHGCMYVCDMLPYVTVIYIIIRLLFGFDFQCMDPTLMKPRYTFRIREHCRPDISDVEAIQAHHHRKIEVLQVIN